MFRCDLVMVACCWLTVSCLLSGNVRFGCSILFKPYIDGAFAMPAYPYGWHLPPSSSYTLRKWVTEFKQRPDGTTVESSGPLTFAGVPVFDGAASAAGAGRQVVRDPSAIAALGTVTLQVGCAADM